MTRLTASFIRSVWATPTGRVGLVVVALCTLLAIVGPIIAPYDPLARNYGEGEKLIRLASPSAKHWLGTTLMGQDVLSQLLWGARSAMIVGGLTAIATVAIGLNVGLIAGYSKGRTDAWLMRITDIFLGLPFLPFIIVILSMTGRNVYMTVFAMTIVMWRSTSRVVRAQVLSLREMPYVAAARISGASDFQIIYREIAPNVMPLALVSGTLALAWAIVTEASIGFLGFGDPKRVSWGSMLYDAYASQVMYQALWWVLPPGVAIMLLVTAVYFVGRTYEEVVNPRLRGI